ncbi:MAG: hypothetical protein IPN42_11910 [Methylococcaceae bacterium]|nr:hypothetical protein [Methylococcaceae bacterium]
MTIKAILHSCRWEFKAGTIRNCVFISIIVLLTLFGTFTDFPYSPLEKNQEGEKIGRLFNFLTMQLIILMVFRYAIFRELDDREFFNQHPIDYKSHYLGKCLFLLVMSVAGDVLAFSVYDVADYYYGNSLGTYSASSFTNKLPTHLSNSLVGAAFIFLAALCRPFHYAVLIAVLTAGFWAVDSHPEIGVYLPFFSTGYGANLIWAPFLLFFGMYWFEWRMIRQPAKQAKFLSNTRFKRLKKLKLNRLLPITMTLVCLGLAVYVARPQPKMPTNRQLENRLFSTLSPLYDQELIETSYFNFSFEKQNRWIAESAAEYADRTWRQLHEEFGVAFDESATLDVFIKASDEHALGTTRGAFIIINANTVNAADDKQSTLNATLRHELTHVLINRLSQYRLVDKNGILSSFLHEGLAQLAEHRWNVNEAHLKQEAALHYNVYGLEILELLPKLERYSEFDYDLNYSLGYVFWTEFVNTYGRHKIKDFLKALADDDPDDKNFEGVQFLFHKAALANIDLYQLLQNSKRQFVLNLAGIDQQILLQAQQLKKPKTLRLPDDTILIPYRFEKSQRIRCIFRKKDSLETRKEWAKTWIYHDYTGSLCHSAKHAKEKVQIVVFFDFGLELRSAWIDIHESLQATENDMLKI